VWLGEVKTPPFSQAARVEAGLLLRQLQGGAKLRLPHSRPMPGIGARCHELRIVDERATWLIIYRLDGDSRNRRRVQQEDTSNAWASDRGLPAAAASVR